MRIYRSDTAFCAARRPLAGSEPGPPAGRVLGDGSAAVATPSDHSTGPGERPAGGDG